MTGILATYECGLNGAIPMSWASKILWYNNAAAFGGRQQARGLHFEDNPLSDSFRITGMVI
jgi:hypothetical protein